MPSLFQHALLVGVWLLAGLAARGQLYLASGHIDLNVGYTPTSSPVGTFGLYAHHASALAGGATVDEPVDNTAFFLPDTGGRIPNGGGLLPFLGQSGQPVWVIPQNSPATTVPWLGFGGYGVPGGDLTAFDPLPALTGSASAPAVRISFLRATTPAAADFALWQTGPTGTPTLYFSNRPGSSARQVFGLRAGQHVHFNWGFSQPGFYRIHLQIEGWIDGEAVPPRVFPIDIAVSSLPLYEHWRRAASRFTLAERADRQIGGPFADPDGDGRANLLEYAFGGDPRLADAAVGAPSISLSGHTPRLDFVRLADPLLHYRAETATDLGAPDAWNEFWHTTGADNLAGPVIVSSPTALSPAAPRAFMRLRVGLVE